MHKKAAAGLALMVWMLTMNGLINLSYGSEVGFFITVALAGFFIVLYMIYPVFSRPRYIRSLNHVAIVYALFLGLVVVHRVLELITYWG